MARIHAAYKIQKSWQDITQEDIMAKTDNRERILAVERILESARMPLTPQKIANRLKSIYDIDANRKTILADIYALTRFINIQQAGRNEGYYIADNIADKESEDNDANSTMP